MYIGSSFPWKSDPTGAKKTMVCHNYKHRLVLADNVDKNKFHYTYIDEE